MHVIETSQAERRLCILGVVSSLAPPGPVVERRAVLARELLVIASLASHLLLLAFDDVLFILERLSASEFPDDVTVHALSAESQQRSFGRFAFSWDDFRVDGLSSFLRRADDHGRATRS